jgi:hypothetical protein
MTEKRTPAELKAQVENLVKRHQVASSRKATLQGQLNAKKQELAALTKEIQSAGFDPRKLREEKERAHTELEKLVDAFEIELSEVESALDSLENK